MSNIPLNALESQENFETEDIILNKPNDDGHRIVVGNPNFYMPNPDDIQLDKVILSPIRSEESIDEGNKLDNIVKDEENSDEKDIMANFVASDDRFYPEGGFKAYTVVFGAFAGLVPVFGAFNMTSVIETYLQNHQLKDQTTTAIGWIFSLFQFMTCFTSIFSGFIFDNYGCKSLMIGGTILYFLSLFLMGECTRIWHFVLCYSLLNGFASGIMMSPLVSVSAHYFKRKRGHAMSLALTGGSIGGVTFPLILRPFFDKNEYKWGIRTISFVSLLY